MGQTLQTLGIYWPKLVAQMINFAIVLFVLWKFAYRPVLALLEDRRRRIAEAMENAEKRASNSPKPRRRDKPFSIRPTRRRIT